MSLRTFFKIKAQEKKTEQDFKNLGEFSEYLIQSAFDDFRVELIKANKKYKRVKKYHLKGSTKDIYTLKRPAEPNQIILGKTGHQISKKINPVDESGNAVQYSPTLSGNHVNMLEIKASNQSLYPILSTDFLYRYMGHYSGNFCISTNRYQINSGEQFSKIALEKVAISIPEIYQYFDESPAAQKRLQTIIAKFDKAIEIRKNLANDERKRRHQKLKVA